MKFVIFIVVFVSVVYAKNFDESIYEEIYESLDDVSDTLAEYEIDEEIVDCSTGFFEEGEPKFDYVSDTSEEEEIYEGIDGVLKRPCDGEGECLKFYDEKKGKPCLNGIGEKTESIFSIKQHKKCKSTEQQEHIDDIKWINYIVFTTCHNMYTSQNYYTTFTLTPQKLDEDCTKRYNYWRIPEFFKEKNIRNLYTKKTQTQTIGKILGSVKRAKEWIIGQHYLCRGHLAANRDFFTINQRKTTFTYSNAAPQFQSFNNGNWKSVENQIINLANYSSLDLLIYVGTYGIGTLKDIKNVTKEIYLGHPKQTVPMPKLFYKLVIAKTLKKGIVLIGVNNPHLDIKEIQTKEYIICGNYTNDQLADEITWMNTSEPWEVKRKDIKRGYVYACSVEDFIREVPIFEVNEDGPYGLFL